MFNFSRIDMTLTTNRPEVEEGEAKSFATSPSGDIRSVTVLYHSSYCKLNIVLLHTVGAHHMTVFACVFQSPKPSVWSKSRFRKEDSAALLNGAFKGLGTNERVIIEVTTIDSTLASSSQSI